MGDTLLDQARSAFPSLNDAAFLDRALSILCGEPHAAEVRHCGDRIASTERSTHHRVPLSHRHVPEHSRAARLHVLAEPLQ